MAIVVGNNSQGVSNGQNNITWEHINAAGDFLLVGFGRFGTGQVKSTGVTFDGDALTNILAVDGTNNTTVEFWYRLNPAVTTADIVVSYATGSDHWGGAVSLSGVDTADHLRGSENAAILSTSISDTIASAVGDIVIAAVTVDLDDVAVTEDGGQSVIVDDVGKASTIAVTGAMGYESGAASNTLGWTWGTSKDSVIALVSIKSIAVASGKLVQSIIMG